MSGVITLLPCTPSCCGQENFLCKGRTKHATEKLILAEQDQWLSTRGKLFPNGPRSYYQLEGEIFYYISLIAYRILCHSVRDSAD
jgi:hypothetical protein